MILPATTRPSFALGRLVGAVGAVLTTALVAMQGLELFQYAVFTQEPTGGEVGVFPLVIVLQTLVAAWVLWSVSRRDACLLLRNLLLAFVGSFVVAYGWYYLLLLLGGDGGGWVGVSNLLYLVGALFVAGGRLSGVGARIGDDRGGHR